MLREGLDLQLVVVEDARLNPSTEKPLLALALKVIGPTYRFLRSRFQLSSEDRKALKYEQQLAVAAEQKANDFIANDLGVIGRPKNVEYLTVSKLNSAVAVNAVVKAAPDLCVVLGTSIIRSRLISIPKIGTINAHTSILPEYRGARSEFWQCYNQHYQNVGVTLHFIDKGVDTGNILFQKKQEASKNADPNDLRANNTFAILENYVPTIQKVLNGEIKPKKQGNCTTPAYRSRDISEKKRIQLYKRLLRKNG